jgi:hypothetical protein
MKVTKGERVKRIMADLIYNHPKEVPTYKGQPSPQGLTKFFKDRYGIDVTRQSITRYLNEGLENYRDTIDLADNDKIQDIRQAMEVQKGIWNNDMETASARTKASQAWRALHKQLIDYEKQLVDARVKMAEVSRPVYLVKIEAPETKVKCPKCGHEWFFNRKKDKREVTEKKRIPFEAGNGQATFDEFTEEDENEK